MSAEEKIAVLVMALERISEATEAEFQEEGYVCPLCRRASTVAHLRDRWAFIQAEATAARRAVGL